MKKILSEIYGNKLMKYSRKKVSLPLYLQDEREFFEVVVLNTAFVIVIRHDAERFNIKSLLKEMAKYTELLKANIVFGFEKITSFQRKSLIENDVPFVSGNGQVYIPFLGSYFDKCANNVEIIPDMFTPSTQLLFLLFLYGKDSYTKSEAAKELHINPMSISRASKQLLSNDLIREDKKGTEIMMSINLNREDYLNKGIKYMINPIQIEMFIPGIKEKKNIPAAGEYSLSLRTEYGYPEYVEYAFDKDNDDLKKIKGVDPNLNKENNLVKIQKWKYNPLLFSKDGNVDPVSLMCSLKDINDERIQKCLNKVKGEISEWRIMMN